MLIDNILPSPDLTDFVRIYRIIDFYFPDGQPDFPKLYTPRPEICLQFYPKDKEQVQYPDDKTASMNKEMTISGQHTVTQGRFVGKDFLSVQVIFQPGTLFQLTGIPSNLLTNKSLNASDIFGNSAAFVNEQLFNAGNYQKMIQIVEDFLKQVIRQKHMYTHPVRKIARLMMRDADKNSLDWYIKESCLCQRQFDRKFDELVGVNPKRFLRIIRFDKAFRMKNRFPKKDWLSIAIECGYHDYQHLVKDYKEFTGLSPAQFTELDTKGPDRIIGVAEI
ncbi:MAG: AraC family transcriptional regulator [Prolixibacteraceae bacterium]|nr:AraC family transcriptional regulator [Prolixibacteraceae bacterium]